MRLDKPIRRGTSPEKMMEIARKEREKNAFKLTEFIIKKWIQRGILK